jgi:two-component system, OmpR family, alkaline phosphatase synthesis response regulator PhoP
VNCLPTARLRIEDRRVYRILLLGFIDVEARSLTAALEQADFRPQSVNGGEAAIDRLLQAPPDMLVIDLAALPQDQLRRVLSDAGIVEHTAVIAVVRDDLVRRLESGPPLDDFVLKPVQQSEFIVRVRLALRRRTNVDAQNVLRCGDLVIDLANYKVTVGGAAVDLTYKEYELLRFLVSNPAKVFTREQLLNRVWGYDYFGGARTVDVHIRRLRSKIERRPGDNFIDTVRNVGYRFREC